MYFFDSLKPAHRVICLGIRIHLSQDQLPVHALVLLLYNFRYFTEHSRNLDFQKCSQALMTDVINAKVIKLTLFICFVPAKSWKTGHLYLKHQIKLLT